MKSRRKELLTALLLIKTCIGKKENYIVISAIISFLLFKTILRFAILLRLVMFRLINLNDEIELRNLYLNFYINIV
jgi:hypothetical protein